MLLALLVILSGGRPLPLPLPLPLLICIPPSAPPLMSGAAKAESRTRACSAVGDTPPRGLLPGSCGWFSGRPASECGEPADIAMLSCWRMLGPKLHVSPSLLPKSGLKIHLTRMTLCTHRASGFFSEDLCREACSWCTGPGRRQRT